MNSGLKSQYRFALITLLLGVVLLVYMVVFEGEPGAGALFLLLAGAVWLLAIRYRARG